MSQIWEWLRWAIPTQSISGGYNHLKAPLGPGDPLPRWPTHTTLVVGDRPQILPIWASHWLLEGLQDMAAGFTQREGSKSEEGKSHSVLADPASGVTPHFHWSLPGARSALFHTGGCVVGRHPGDNLEGGYHISRLA